ncbi:MAG: Ig-like domain-containing protein, partial [Chloroflexi bacterium]|nr:Ig-like domain-containing protein [Chloroflexota bacterium]
MTESDLSAKILAELARWGNSPAEFRWFEKAIRGTARPTAGTARAAHRRQRRAATRRPSAGRRMRTVRRSIAAVMVPARLLMALYLAIMWTLGTSVGSLPTTEAFMTSVQTKAGNAIASAEQFAPTGLNATVGGSSVALAWTAPSDGGSWVAGYRVYRATVTGGPYTALASGGCMGGATVNGESGVFSSATLSCTDGTVVSNTSYYYVVRAVSNYRGSTVNSNEVFASIDVTAPTVTATNPANTATGVPRSSNIVITFSESMTTGATQTAFSASPSITCVWTWNSPTNSIATCNPSADMAGDT